MLATALVALALVSPNTEQLAVNHYGALIRPGVRLQSRLRRLEGLRAPMAPHVRVLPAGPEIQTYAAADGKNGIIYTGGPLDDFTMAHEQYHLLDAQVMTDADRKRFTRIMGRQGDPWFVGDSSVYGDASATPGYRGSVGEAFADMAAMVALHRDPKGRVQDYGYLDRMPSRKKLLRFGRALERLGRRYGLDDYHRPS